MKGKFLTLLAATSVLSAVALPLWANTAADKYTWGPLERNVQNLWINTNIPTGCRYAVTDGATKWTNANLRFTYVYKGVVSLRSWIWDTSATNPNTGKLGDNFSTSNNTIDTQVEAGTTDYANSLAQVEWRTKSYDPATGRYVFLDGDTIVSSSQLSSSLWCSANVPNNMYDFQTVMLHELGHVMGLEHDAADTANVTVVNNPVYPGEAGAKRTLTARDIERAVYLYGAP